MEHQIEWVISDIRLETPDTKTFFLQPTDDSPLQARAGQFLTFLFEIHGKTLRRSYSLSSIQSDKPDLIFVPRPSPFVPFAAAITVKRIENGEVSRLLFDHTKVGDSLQSLSPMGRFVLESTHPPTLHYWFIVGGSGISPVFSLIQELLFTQPKADVVLLYASHSEGETIFYPELEALKEVYPKRLTIEYFFSRSAGHSRRLNQDFIERNMRKRARSMAYLCGPLSLMRMAQMMLKMMGWSESQIRQEDFIPPPHFKPYNLPIFNEQVKAVFQIHGGEYEVVIPAGKTILDAALESGVALPYSCKGGVCTSCLCRCTKGSVVMPFNQKLLPSEVEEGLTLTCIAYPNSEELIFSYETTD